MDITVEELKSRLKEEHAPALIDVRETYEHDEFNIGGQNLPLGDIQQWIADLEDLKEKEVVVYCRSGNRSAMAVNFMQVSGFSQVRNLTGGVISWIEAFGQD